MAAIRYVGAHTKISITWQPRGRHDPAWVEGMYIASISSMPSLDVMDQRRVHMDHIVLHVFKEPGAATGATARELGVAVSDLGKPNGYDAAARWALYELARGAKEVPHWRWGKAVTVARAVAADMAQHGGTLRRESGARSLSAGRSKKARGRSTGSHPMHRCAKCGRPFQEHGGVGGRIENACPPVKSWGAAAPFPTYPSGVDASKKFDERIAAYWKKSKSSFVPAR